MADWSRGDDGVDQRIRFTPSLFVALKANTQIEISIARRASLSDDFSQEEFAGAEPVQGSVGIDRIDEATVALVMHHTGVGRKDVTFAGEIVYHQLWVPGAVSRILPRFPEKVVYSLPPEDVGYPQLEKPCAAMYDHRIEHALELLRSFYPFEYDRPMGTFEVA